MMIRTPLIAASLAAMALGLSVGAAHAGTNVYVQVGTPHMAVAPALMPVQYRNAPPPPRYERVPAPRRGMVWSQGYWEMRGHRHVWIPGTWMRVRPGYSYHQPGWQQRNNQWYFNKGSWDTDRDGDPDRYDRRPNNPHRQ